MDEEKEFGAIIDAVAKHLKQEKVFIQNPERVREIYRALEIANILFPDHATEIKDDPLQTGALILCITCTDIYGDFVVAGTREMKLFQEMISKADNFEIYNLKGNLHFAAVFTGAFERL